MTNHERAKIYTAKSKIMGIKSTMEFEFRPNDQVILDQVSNCNNRDGMLKVPNFVTKIKSGAFMSSNIKEVYIDNSPNRSFMLIGAFRLMNTNTFKLRMSHPEMVVNAAGAFSEMSNLEKIDLGDMQFTGLKNIDNLFAGCGQLENVDIHNFINSPLISIDGAFANCRNLKNIAGIELLNTGSIERMSYLFYGCGNIEQLDLSKWQTVSCKHMEELFAGCKKLQVLHIKNWDTSNVIRMDAMFYGCESMVELDIANWRVSNTLSFKDMFLNCKTLKHLDLSKWAINRKAAIDRMFIGCRRLDLSSVGLNIRV